jgi:hypothetical protein
MSDRTPRERLHRRSERGFQGYPIATIAFYGPDLLRASKVAVGIVRGAREPVSDMEKWLSDVTDVREDAVIGGEVLAFIRRMGARTVVVGPGILGCPHEEGKDYPHGAVCPRCPYWAGRERPI